MEKRAIFVSALAVITLGIFVMSGALGATQKVSVSNSVYSSLQNSQNLRVIIKLKPEIQKTFFSLASFSFKTVNESVNATSVIDEIGKRNIKHRFSDGTISTLINSTELSKLQNNPNVGSIVPDEIFHLDLQQSVSLINASIAQKTIYDGINLTGKGQTICIIDSGVDYNLSDLGGCYGYNNASSNCTVIGGYNYLNNSATPMDDFGHGTHVAGIVAAHRKITGVAPGARIIAIKACNATGSCLGSDIKAGIDWCVNNASKFNISVISMSLGGGLYTDYCNSFYNGGSPYYLNWVSSINNAIAKNVSVVAAAGNGLNNNGIGNSTAISSPACISGVIPVGASYKNDTMAGFSDRWPLGNMLFAPGVDINSTMTPTPSGDILSQCGAGKNYCQLSGTSMSTPFVSASIMIMNEYLKLNDKSLTPPKIESYLNQTGKHIIDPTSGSNFSRINTYSALLSIDSEAPAVTLISPKSNSSSTNTTQTFSCNATDLALKNMTFRVWNSTKSYYNKTKNSTGFQNSSSFGLSAMNYSTYKWNCFYTDENGNVGFSAQNSTFTLSRQLLFLFPSNNTYTNRNETFECNSSYSNETLSKITFKLYNSTGLFYNITENITGHSDYSKFHYNFTSQGEYKWSCSFNTSNNTVVKSGNYSVYYDTTPPYVTAISPANSSSKTGTQQVSFSYNISDNIKIGSCSLVLNDKTEDSNSTLSSGENSFQYTLSPGKYNWSIKCYDKAGNMNYTTLRLLTVNSPPESSSGGGGGSSSFVPAPSQRALTPTNNITEGYTVKIPEYNYQSFKLSDNQSHIMFVDKVNASSAEITVESNPIRFILSIGESKYLNLTSPYYYDLYVRLNRIDGNSANITVREVTTSNRIFHTSNYLSGNNSAAKPVTQSKYNLEIKDVLIITISIMLIITFFIFSSKRKRSKKRKAKKQ